MRSSSTSASAKRRCSRVYGGKLTTYRRLAEDVLDRLAHFFPRSRPWTAQSPLPGGDFVYDGVAALIARTQRRWPFLTDSHARRLVGAYGTRVESVLRRPPGSTISACASAPTSPPPRCAT